MRARLPKVWSSCRHLVRYSGSSGYPHSNHSRFQEPVGNDPSGSLLRFRHQKIGLNHDLYLRIGGVRTKFSLAEHIKSLLPEGALEDPKIKSNDHSIEHDDIEMEDESQPLIEPLASLAAFESEVRIAESLVKSLAYKETASYIVNNMPLSVALTALVDRMVPIIRSSPLSEMGILELAYCLFNNGHMGLAGQFLHAAGIHGSTMPLEIISHLDNRDQTELSSGSIDVFVSEFLPQQHFPQLLSRSQLLNCSSVLSTWFKVRLLAFLPWRECDKWLNRYWNELSNPENKECVVPLLAFKVSNFSELTKWVLCQRPEDVLLLIRMVRTPQELHILSRPLLRPSKISTLTEDVVIALLKASIRQKQSYDIANICHRLEHILISDEKNYSVLADALLAVAFAQKRPPMKSVEEMDVTEPSHKLRSSLITMVLPNDTAVANVIVCWAARRLDLRHKQRKIPGHALWQLLSSLPPDMPLNGYTQSELSKLLVQRPYIEQIRYMALPTITQSGIRQLLRQHIMKIVEHRRRHHVGWNTLQDKEDVQLLVAGMIIASEKSKQYHTQNQSETLESIMQLFENDEVQSDNSSATVLATLMSDFESFSAGLAMQVTAELVSQKNYIVAQQMLRMLGPKRLSTLAFDNLLITLTETNPDESYYFITWLISENPRAVSVRTMNEVLTTIVKEKTLSESQLMNRFQTLRQIMGSQMHREIGIDPAKAFVDVLIWSSKERKGGSRMRLKWALEVAHKAGVPAEVFESWTQELQQMNANHEGFWYNT